METVHLQTKVCSDGMVHLKVPCGLPPGPVEVTVMISQAQANGERIHWRDFCGLGKEIWGEEDAQQYVRHLREEWGP